MQHKHSELEDFYVGWGRHILANTTHRRARERSGMWRACVRHSTRLRWESVGIRNEKGREAVAAGGAAMDLQ